MSFFIIFAVLPLLEIIVFIAIGYKIGFLTTVLIALLMAIAGAFIIKYQGFSTMIKAQEAIRKNEMPSKELFDGLIIMIAACLMIMPGFISDILGFILLLPNVREAMRGHLAKSARFQMQGFNAEFTEFHDIKSQHRPKDPDVIDVDFENISKDDKP